jgi:cytidyltransferase-like protein
MFMGRKRDGDIFEMLKHKKVFVSGCFDLLHSGHVNFLEIASKYGDLYVSVGSDKTIINLKNKKPIYNEKERLYIIKSISFVKDAFIGSGSGKLDFIKEFKNIKPDIFIVNEDGNCEEKRKLCKKYNVEYIVLKRFNNLNIPLRSTSDIIKNINIPYRIEMAGGWLDQPWISKYSPGPVITISVEPTYKFEDRSGMATSTRNKAIELWGNNIPFDNYEKLSKILFCYNNPPGSRYISGSQDSLGIILPGINYLHYNGDYWPDKILSTCDEKILIWLEQNYKLVQIRSKSTNCNIFAKMNIKKQLIKKLSLYSSKTWENILDMNEKELGKNIWLSFKNKVEIFPLTLDKKLMEKIDYYRNKSYGVSISGAKGKYLSIITPDEIEGSIKIKIRRS